MKEGKKRLFEIKYFFFIEFNIEKSRHINKDEIKKERETLLHSDIRINNLRGRQDGRP